MDVTLKPNWPRWSALRSMLVVLEPRIFQSISTTWWTCDRRHLYHKPGLAFPCDPHDNVLMECDARVFLQGAEADPARYGTHGLNALAAAFHGSLVVAAGDKAGCPTCLESWDQVNEVIDRCTAED